MTPHRYLIYGQPVDFMDCQEVAEGFGSILRGWQVVEVPYDPAVPAFVTFRKRGRIYDWNTPWVTNVDRRLDDPSKSVMEAVCDFHYEFIDWFADRNPDYFCVHMAAIEFSGRAVLFPAVQKAGKSTLAMHCVERGHRLLGDDVVALDPQSLKAVALGLMPRMRLPLHPSFSAPFRDFLGQHAGLSDRRWQYAALDGTQILDYGQTRAVAGIVILDRRPDAKAELSPAPASSAVKALIDRNFGALDKPGLIFDCFKALALQADCKRLTYSNPADAAQLLEDAFGRLPISETKQQEGIHAGA